MTRTASRLAAAVAAALALAACSAPADSDYVPVGLVAVTSSDRDADGANLPDGELRVTGRAAFGRTLAELPAVDDADGWTDGADACVVLETGLPGTDDGQDGISTDPIDALPDLIGDGFVLARAASGDDPVVLFRAGTDPNEESERYLTLAPEDPDLIVAYAGERTGPEAMPEDLHATADGALWIPGFTVGPVPVTTPAEVTPRSDFGADVRFAWTPTAANGADAVLLLLTIEARGFFGGPDLACVVRDRHGTFDLPEGTRDQLPDDWEADLRTVRRDAVRIVEAGRGPDAGPLLVVGSQERTEESAPEGSSVD